MIEKINNFINKNVMTIFIIFLFIQPILDLVAGIMLYNNITFTLSSIIRIFFLIFVIYYLLFISDKKYRKFLYIIFAYCILFIITNILSKSNCNILSEIKYLLNSIYFPIILLFIFDILKKNKIDERILFKILMIYLILIFVPNILNIGFKSYWHSKTGSVGFFYSANAIGNIISVISPLLILYFVINKKIILSIIFFAIYSYVLLTLGTKAPILCAFIVFIYYLLLYIVKMFKNKKYKQIFLILLFLIIFTICIIKVIPLTPFYKNIVIHLKYLKIKKFSDLMTFKNIDHFVFSSRLKFFYNEFNLFKKSNIFQKLLGIGYLKSGKIIKIAEMDYLDTFICQGIIGFIIIYFNYFKIIISTIFGYFKNFKKNFYDMRKSSMIIIVFISILCALLTGHTLATPSVSIFVALLIVISYNNMYERKI